MRILVIFCLLFVACLGYSQPTTQASEDTAMLSVTVTDMEGNIRPNDKIIFIGKHTQTERIGISDKQGVFQVFLPEGDIYQIKIQGLGNQIDFDEVAIPRQVGIITGELVVKYRPEQKFTLDDVHFETNKAKLLSSSYAVLNQLVEIMQIKPNMRVEIGGHTDNVGEEKSNLVLSQKRAEAVVNYLVGKGIERSRLVSKGYGEQFPIADNQTASGRQQNRRTEALILSE